jgi:hypothetical protein
VHIALPVAHDSVPVWHALAGVHGPPLLHATHIPALHTIPVVPVAHDIPVGLFPVSTHTCDPVAHEYIPVLQGLVGWHAPPAVHDTHIPARHTRFAPHIAPSASAIAVSVQTAAPVSHA